MLQILRFPIGLINSLETERSFPFGDTACVEMADSINVAFDVTRRACWKIRFRAIGSSGVKIRPRKTLRWTKSLKINGKI